MELLKAFIILILVGQCTSILYPRDSETRDHRSLDGIWNFMLEPPSDEVDKNWFLNDLKLYENVAEMPVPSSYNDITSDKNIRDHVGPVWYQRSFYAPSTWNSENSRIWLRFGSVNYDALVWVNGIIIASHEIGHLPFETEVTHLLVFGENNLITVQVDNTLNQFSIPQGKITNRTTDYGYRLTQSNGFDFFNYAGIHRSVLLYTTPIIHIEDISVITYFDEGRAVIEYQVLIIGNSEIDPIPLCHVTLFDKAGINVTSYLKSFYYKTSNDIRCQRKIVLDNPKLWWPYLMDSDPGYLYTLEVKLLDWEGNDIDIYRLPVGIRTIRWTNSSLLINEKPIYLRGFGKHEDFNIRGKGLDLPLVTKDFNLIKWVGANTFRTSHYPHAEEIMDFADRNGIMIIDECPSVNTENFSPNLLTNHKHALQELISRDKNHPSVIAWSIANEPKTHTDAAGVHFKEVADYVRTLDNTRPITLAVAVGVSQDKSGDYVDIISFNRYNGWYSSPGQSDMIINQVVNEARKWHIRFNKPVLMSEYGADAMQGQHLNPAFIWSEEYQVEVLSQHFMAFDILRWESFFIGEFVSHFADFKTAQSKNRVGENKKGVFTREREPKASAHHLRRRYLALAAEIDKIALPNDVYPYIISKNIKSEL